MKFYYVGLDIHKSTTSFCMKQADGKIVNQGTARSTRHDLRQWASTIDCPWIGGMEATIFTSWVYDLLEPFSHEMRVAHPYMLKAISAAKKKSDRIDAAMLADLLRADLFPECYMMPIEMRDLRRLMRYRGMIVREAVRMKNKITGLLLESGAEYESKRLHGKKYFGELLETLDYIPESVVDMLGLTRGNLEYLNSIQAKVRRRLMNIPLLAARVELLKTIDGVGDITALTWAVEIGDLKRFNCVKKAVSYCGLCSAQRSSAGVEKRGPISKMRNKHIQSTLIEAAKLAPTHNEYLKKIYDLEKERGNWNRATLAVARKLVAFLFYVDKNRKPFDNMLHLSSVSV